MNEQYLDMLRVYFECDDTRNSYQASQRHQQLYPNRHHPNRCKFQRLANNNLRRRNRSGFSVNYEYEMKR
jgi:hypothetical protein